MTPHQPELDISIHKASRHTMCLHDYQRAIECTDRLPQDDVTPVILGLFGEVGSLLAVPKKRYREGAAFLRHTDIFIEEFGDVLWYFTALCRRLGREVSQIVLDEEESMVPTIEVASNTDQPLLSLGRSAGKLIDITNTTMQPDLALSDFASNYVQAARAAGIGLSDIIDCNWTKVTGRYIDQPVESLPTFDSDFPEEERLPSRFEIRVIQRASGQGQLRWNGVFIGDPLSDNISDPDGYRFHDVFHLSYAAILHWSPTFRSLIKHKRKSAPDIDEAQDGGRAIVIEEGLTAWIFSQAKELDLFEGQTGLSFDILKTVQQFVRGYEVEACPLALWERAILDGYSIFRKVLYNGGGTLIGDRRVRRIIYKE